MTPEQFVYWLQGYVEIGKPEGPVWEEIKSRLYKVLTKKSQEIASTPLTPQAQDQLRRELGEGLALRYDFPGAHVFI